MGKKEFIEAWNQAFFPDGELNNGATLDIEATITFAGGKVVQFSVKGITPRTRINELARLYADSLSDSAIPQEAAAEMEKDMPDEALKAEPVAEEVIANNHVEYRNNQYLVQHYRIGKIDHYNIIKNDGSKVGAETVTGRAILKRYREG